MIKQPSKGGSNSATAVGALAASIFNRNRAPSAGPNDRNSPGARNDDGVKGLAEAAFDIMVAPFSVFRRGAGADPSENSNYGARSNNEISRLSLHYSSANLSEEESSSLINILDRKKYHERLAATRSAEEQMQPR